MKYPSLLAAFATLALASCAATPPPCDGPTTRNLGAAVDHVKDKLAAGCTAQFDGYFDTLLNTRLFSGRGSPSAVVSNVSK